MLDNYFKHAAEREGQGIPPLPLNPEDTAEVCRLLEAPPAGEAGRLLALLRDRVSPGVDPSAKVKAAWLADIARGRKASPAVSPAEAVFLLGTMIGGYNVGPLVEFLDVPALAKDAAEALKGTILAMEQSSFQTMVMAENQTLGRFFTLNGYIQLTAKDEFIYHDMIVHPAFAVNPAIRRVLIIGGGDGGTAREVCRYPHIDKVDLVEIDEMVIRICKKHLPQTACGFNNPRLNLIIGDGLAHVMRSPDKSYDLILVDSTDPVAREKGCFPQNFTAIAAGSSAMRES
jgi:hypothetical protein